MVHTLQAIAIVLTLALTVATAYLVVKAVRQILGVLHIGQPVSRSDSPGSRWATMVKETFGHTRMFQWRWVGVMHWFVYFGFLILSSAVATGFVQLFDPKWQIWWIGHWFVFEWIEEGIGVLSTIGIVFLIVYRQLHKPAQLGRRSRFFGSTFWQAYFVEFMALLEGVAILFIRGAERKLEILDGHAHRAGAFHYPVSQALSGLYGDSADALKSAIIVIAFVKVASALVWLDVIGLNLTMGIAWHRFTAWPNIWFKREAKGRDADGATTALGAMKPLTSNGRAITLEDIDDLDEDAKLGVGSIQDFSWKGILDFTTCTECGRCQSQCPAWNTEKPLSPKLLVMGLRDHAYEAAPYLQSSDPAASEAAVLQKSLIGKAPEGAGDGSDAAAGEWFYNPEGGDFVIDEDVLWSCTSCGACVQQCPVDIEHVDHIMDMRRYQVLVESNFPTELNGLFKGLENKGNPWNMSSSARLDWAKDLPFEVKVVGETIESLDEVDWLFWVGCAGAYEDRAKKTTRAVAELLDLAGISFGVLGNGETCTGDPARRAGNEFVFQGLAQQNVETFKEYKVKKAVTTCAHCFNTLKNEYKELGIELEVVHHTQLLNRLVREGRLTPVADGAGAHKRSITYHDPCYIGRHNGVYTPPRELLQVLPGAEYVEMPRNSERSFCCGAGGARMWMEERIGERINRNRTDEAVATGADQIAVGCPFCRVMLSDGLTAAQSDGTARESVEVLDVAQMLLASVKGEQATKLLPGEGAAAAPAAKAAGSVETKAEPEAGDVTITEDTVTATEDMGPAAKASGGSSLFDSPAEAPAEEKAAGKAPDDASSLFDTPAPAEPETKPEVKPSGGSLFDLGGEEPETADAAQAPAAEPEAKKEEPTTELGSGGSLFDIAGDQPEAKAAPAETAPEPEADAEAEAPKAAEPEATEPATDLGSSGSLFDIVAEQPEAKAAPAETAPAAESEPAAEKAPEPEAAEEAPEPEAQVAPSSGAASTPQTDVDFDSLGSLFDLEAPQGAVASAPAPATPATPEAAEPEAPEAEAPEPAEDKASVQEPPVEQAAPEPAKAAEPEPQKPAAATPAASSGTVSEPRSDVDFDSLGSLFEIEAPQGQVAAAPAPAPAERESSEPEPEVAEEAPADEPVANEAVEAETGEPEAEPEPEAEEEAEEQKKPQAPKPAAPAASSGEAHTPRTDVDINEAGSLFDL